MDSKNFNKYKTVADIIEKTFNTLNNLMLPGAKIYDLSSFVDDQILTELNKTYKNLKKGLAMPTCMSVNNLVCHYHPLKNDDYELKSGDIVRIEVAGFIDDCCVTLGDTIEIETTNLDKKVAQAVLSTGIRLIEPFMEINEFDKLIKKMLEPHGYYLLQRPYLYQDEDVKLRYDWSRREDGKFLEQSWVVRCDEEIDLEDLNELSEEKYQKDIKFNIGDIYHLELAISKDNKPCQLSMKEGTLYQKTYKRYQLKGKFARELITDVNKNMHNYLFAIDNLNLAESKAKLGMKECLNHQVIRNFGLIEKKNADVIRLKCSVAIQENSVYILTGKNNILQKIDDIETNKDFLKIFNKNPKFNKRYQEESSN